MAYCSKCGAYIPDGMTRCLACGYDDHAEQTAAQYAYKYDEAQAKKDYADGMAAYESHSLEKAGKLFSKCLVYAPENVDALVMLARVKCERGEIPKAKVYECYAGWRQHASKGNNFKLIQRMDQYLKSLWTTEDMKDELNHQAEEEHRGSPRAGEHEGDRR